MFKSLFKSAKAAVAVATQEEIPAEVIHAEVDAAEEFFLKQVKEIIASKSQETIAIDSRETRKADLLKDLGFGNSELIKDVSTKQQVNDRLAKEAKLLEQSVDLFNKYKSTYPLEKIMPFEEFEKVLKKYSLIYAPSQAYIKDVPEKNLLEIKNSKTLAKMDSMPPIFYISQVKARWNGEYEANQAIKIINADKNLRFYNSKFREKTSYTFTVGNNSNAYDFKILDGYCIKSFDKEFLNSYAFAFPHFDGRYMPNSGIKISDIINHFETSFRKDMSYFVKMIRILKEIDQKYPYMHVERHIITEVESSHYSHTHKVEDHLKLFSLQVAGFEYKEISREGLFIAAPKSHFDLESLTKVEKYGYYAKIDPIKVVVTKDPIAFQFLEGNEQYPEGFVRILSKWGTSDDQSYLDPEVQHGLMN